MRKRFEEIAPHLFKKKKFSYRQIETYCKQAVKRIYLYRITISATKFNCLKKILSTVEKVIIDECDTTGDFYKNFLIFCKYLKGLNIKTYHNPNENIVISADNRWLTRKYSALEHIELYNKKSIKIDELKIFFQQNRNFRSFATNSTLLLKNLDFFEKTDIKLEMLAIRFDGNHLAVVCDNLNAVYERGVFQQLHWYTERAFNQMAVKFFSIHSELCTRL